MASEKNPSIFDDRGGIGSSDELDKYGVWVKNGPQDIPDSSLEVIQPAGGEIPDFDGFQNDFPQGEAEAGDFDAGTEDETSFAGLTDTFDFEDSAASFDGEDFSDFSGETDAEPPVFDSASEDFDFSGDGSPDDDFSLPDEGEAAADFSRFSLEEESGGSGDSLSLDDFPEAEESPGGGETDGFPETSYGDFSLEPLGEAPAAEGIDSLADFGSPAEDPFPADFSPEAGEAAGDHASLDDFFLDDDFPLPDGDEEALVDESVPPGAGTGQAELSNQLLLKIANELGSIKSELASLKEELSAVQRHAGEPASGKGKPGGFFGGSEDEDETIALTGDEMDNILKGADFTEEEGAAESPDQEMFPGDLGGETAPEFGDGAAPAEAGPEEAAPEALSELPLDDFPGMDAPGETPAEESPDFAFEDAGEAPLDTDPEAEEPDAGDDSLETEPGEEIEEISLDFLLDDAESPAGEEAPPEPAAEPSPDDFPGMDAPGETPAEESPDFAFEDAGEAPLDAAPEAEEPDAGGDSLETEPGEEIEEISLDFLLDDEPGQENSGGPRNEAAFAETPAAEGPGFEQTIPEGLNQEGEAASEEDFAFFDENFAADDSILQGEDGLEGSGINDDLALDLDSGLEMNTGLDEPVLDLEGPAETEPAAEDGGIIFEDLNLDLPEEEEPQEASLREEPAEPFPDIALDGLEEPGIPAEEFIPEPSLEEGLSADADAGDDPFGEDPFSDAAAGAVAAFGGVGGEEDPASPPSVAAVAGAGDQSSEFARVPPRIKDELRTVLSYMDQLLESLPEEKIEEFARSEYFDTYKKLFEELGLV